MLDDGTGAALYASGAFTVDTSDQGTVAKLTANGWAEVGELDGPHPYKLAVFDDGSGPTLYAAGHLGDHDIVKWQKGAWVPLGAGITGPGSIADMTVFDDGSGPALYVAGNFTSAGGVPASAIARWDGTEWSALGAGANGFVAALGVFDDGRGPALYAGGDFDSAGGVRVSGFARWDGRSWSDVGGGVTGGVRAITAFQDGSGPSLYVGGTLSSAGGTPVSNIARWDGAVWHPVGSGVDDDVYVLKVIDLPGSGAALYAGGQFEVAGEISALSIAKWDGRSWSAVGEGLGSTVYDIEAFDDGLPGGTALYAGGYFTSINDGYTSNVARWDGIRWSALGAGFESSVKTMVSAGDEDGLGPALYAGGIFDAAGRATIARWDGTVWSPLLRQPGAWVNALAIGRVGQAEHSVLYAAGPVPELQSIASWDGSSWSPLGSNLPISSGVHSLVLFDDGCGGGACLIAGGWSQGDKINVARWDGRSWSLMGAGLSGGCVCALAVVVGDDGRETLFAGGEFTTSGGRDVLGVAQWNGNDWEPVGAGFAGTVRTLMVLEDGNGAGRATLVAGGQFALTGDGDFVNNLASWDGESWTSVGGGVNGIVWALHEFDDGTGPALFVGGTFETTGDGTKASGLARWDGEQWAEVGGGIEPAYQEPAVFALATFRDPAAVEPSLFIAGSFDHLGGMRADCIARMSVCRIGDLDGNGVVNDLDLMALLDDWGSCPDPPEPCAADLDGDGTVGITDLLVLLAHWTE